MSITTEATTTAKEKAEALRALADLVEANPELVGEHSSQRVLVYATSPEDMARLTRLLGGTRRKEADDMHLSVIRDFGAGVSIEVYSSRSQVCEARVVGTETVEVPDPDAPKVTVERDVIEWVCSPILEAEVA